MRGSPNCSQFYYGSKSFFAFSLLKPITLLNYVWPKKESLLSSNPLSQSVRPYMCICVSRSLFYSNLLFPQHTNTYTSNSLHFLMKKKSQPKLGHSQRQNGSRGAMATIGEVRDVSTADSPRQVELQRRLSLIVSWLVLKILKKRKYYFQI